MVSFGPVRNVPAEALCMMLFGCVGWVRQEFNSMGLQAPLQIALWRCLVVQGGVLVLTWMCMMPYAHSPA